MAVKKTTDVQRRDDADAPVLSDKLIQMFTQMAMMVPDTAGDANESILLAILGAKTWDELDDPWDTRKADALVDKDIRIDTIMRRPSDFAGGLGVYLVVQGKDMDTDEPITFTTGSMSCVGQLVGAYANGWFPLYAILRKAQRPTSKGYYPMHIEFTGQGDHVIKAEVIDQ